VFEQCNGCGGLFGKYAPLFPGASHSYFQSFYPSSASQKSHMGNSPDPAPTDHGFGGSSHAGPAFTLSSDPFTSPTPITTLRASKHAARSTKSRSTVAVSRSAPQKVHSIGCHVETVSARSLTPPSIYRRSFSVSSSDVVSLLRARHPSYPRPCRRRPSPRQAQEQAP